MQNHHDQPLFIHVSCPVCGADDARTRWETPLGDDGPAPLESCFRCTNAQYGRFGRIVQCHRCGAMYRDPQERDPLRAYEATVDEDYLQEWPSRRLTFLRSLRQLHRFAQPPGDLLDVGCATGFFLRVARDAGWHAVGLEPSHWAAEQARREGLEVYEGSLEDAPLGAEQFDVITLWDVIEHLRDPREALRAAWRLLRPGGVIGLTTMETGSLVARLMGARWPHLMRMHLCYLRYGHVARLLQEIGFVEPRRRPHVRVLSAGYLASRLRFIGPRAAEMTGAIVRALGLKDRQIPLYVGDLMAVYARKPGPEAESTAQEV